MSPEEREALEAVLEPEGWEPPETLSGPEVLALAARPGEPAADVLDDYYAEVADGILTGRIKGSAAKVVARAFADEDPAPFRPPTPTPPRPVATSPKKLIRYALHERIQALGLPIRSDDRNALANAVWKRVVRPLQARIWAEGFEAGTEFLSQCCGCSGSGLEEPPNPYDHEEA